MKKTLLRLIGLSTLVVLLSGTVAAQSLPADASNDLTPTGINSQGGRNLTHSVLSEFGSPTG